MNSISDKIIIPDSKKYLYTLIMKSNIKNFNRLLKEYKDLDNTSKLDLIKEIYIDPDTNLKEIIDKREDKEYRLSFDSYCSLNALSKYYDIDELPEKLYQVRKSCLIWPKHPVPTFNTLRSKIPKDRVDYTLFIIKKYFESGKDAENSIFYYVIENSKSNISKNWINSFKDFKEFVNYLGYKHLVEDDYSIIDYGTKEKIKDIICIPSIDKDYIEGLLERIDNCEGMYKWNFNVQNSSYN